MKTEKLKTAEANLNKAHVIFTGEEAAKNDGIFGIKVGDKLTRHSTQLMWETKMNDMCKHVSDISKYITTNM